MRRLLIVLAVLVACMAPNAAYAQEVDFVDSFSNGVGTWGSGQEEEMDSNSSVREIENGGLLAAPAEGAEGEMSTQQQIQSVVDAWNTVQYDGRARSLWGSVNVFLRTVAVPLALGLAFMWWGLRKSLRMIMVSFRKGKVNV